MEDAKIWGRYPTTWDIIFSFSFLTFYLCIWILRTLKHIEIGGLVAGSLTNKNPLCEV